MDRTSLDNARAANNAFALAQKHTFTPLPNGARYSDANSPLGVSHFLTSSYRLLFRDNLNRWWLGTANGGGVVSEKQTGSARPTFESRSYVSSDIITDNELVWRPVTAVGEQVLYAPSSPFVVDQYGQTIINRLVAHDANITKAIIQDAEITYANITGLLDANKISANDVDIAWTINSQAKGSNGQSRVFIDMQNGGIYIRDAAGNTRVAIGVM
jgi:hypothetical protein